MENDATADKGIQSEDRAERQPATQQRDDPGKLTLPAGAIPTDAAAPGAGQSQNQDDSSGRPEPAPEGYELAVPDGFEIDQKGMDAFKAAAAKHKLPKEGAQELFDMFHAKVRESADLSRAELRRRMEELYAADRRAIDADPVYGGRNFGRSQEMVAKALVRFAGERNDKGEFDFVNELKERGMANSPKLFRFLARVGEHLSEAGPAVSDGRGAPAGKLPQEVLFGEYGRS